MGVKRMKGFIHRYQVQQLRDFELHDAVAIMDGSELFYFLYFDHDSGRIANAFTMGWAMAEVAEISSIFERETPHKFLLVHIARRGGEYSNFRSVINEFFDILVNHCKIQCYVVFDRFKSENHIERYLKLRTDKLNYVTNIVEGRVAERGVRAQPCLGKDVLKQTLHELSVPYIVVPGDGDAELAAIANEMNGYVLATDTDFCVFELSRGFISLDDLRWRDATDRCPCKIFHRRTLEETFRIPPRAIAFLEPLLSNQEDLQVDFSPFFEAISNVAPRRGRRPRSDPLQNVLVWLGREYRNDDAAIASIRHHVPNLPEEMFRRCLDVYRIPPDVAVFVDKLQHDGDTFGHLTRCFNVFGRNDDPVDFLPLIPDDQDRPSCNKITSSIRYAIYQIGMMKGEAGSRADRFNIVVTDRRGREYAADIIDVEVNRSALEELHVEADVDALRGRDDMSDVMRLREEYVLGILSRGEDHGFVENFGHDTKLLAAIFKYWTSSTEDDERHVDEAVKALAFTLSATYYDSDLIPEIAELPEDVFDIKALHSSSQWLICVKDATALNIALGKPLDCIVMGRLFSGLLYQRAFSYFVSSDDVDRANLFVNDKDARVFYDNLLNL